MDARQRLAVHLPGEHDFVNLDFAIGNRYNIVVDVVLLEVGVCAEEFAVLPAVFETAAVFDDFFEADARVARGADGA